MSDRYKNVYGGEDDYVFSICIWMIIMMSDRYIDDNDDDVW